MTAILRFAPSPTGRIHIGNLRTALLNWLYAHKTGGQFILRLDDTDTERSTQAFADGIKEDLTWIGLTWDRVERQSSRFDRYGDVVAQLKKAGRLYPCYETADELDRKRKRQRARGLPPVYDRAALRLTTKEKATHEAEGRHPHWRFLLNNCGDTSGKSGKIGQAIDTAAIAAGTIAPTPVRWIDLVRGEQMVDLGSLSDPVLIRADGTYLYTLCSVIDDIDFKITHLMRGDDHLTNSGVQVQIFQALRAQPPKFAHHSLLIGADGQALSKRLGSLSIESFRLMKLEPMAVASHAGLIGTSDALAPMNALSELAEMFAFSKLSSAPGRFDLEELQLLNAKLLLQLSYASVADRLGAMGLPPSDPMSEAFWLAVRPNVQIFDDVGYWQDVIGGDITPVIEDAGFCTAAAKLLPSEPWDHETWGAWTKAVKTQTKRKGRALFHPLRLALTGREKGPELKALLPLMGRTRALSRLQPATS